MSNNPMDVAKKYAIKDMEADSAEMEKELQEQGYEVKGVTAIKKDDIWEYLKEAKPQVLVMHNVDPTHPTKVQSGLFILDHEAMDNSRALQRVVQGALGDDVRNDAVHQLFVRTVFAGLHSKQPPEIMIPVLEKILGMDPSLAASIDEEASAKIMANHKKHLN